MGIWNSLRWIIDDLLILLPEADQEAARKTARITQEFHAMQNGGLLVRDDGTSKGADETGINTARRLWTELATASNEAVSHRPLLHPWYRLGRSMGRCFLDLFDAPQQRILPSLPHVIRAAADLPKCHVRRIAALSRLAAQDLDIACPLPLPLLCDLLDERLDELVAFAPAAAAIPRVARLDLLLKTALENEPDGPVDIVFDPRQPYARFESQVYPINASQGLILEEIINGDHEFVSSDQMMRKHTRLESANISREVNSLPDAILRHIQSRKHYGYRWVDVVRDISPTSSDEAHHQLNT